MRLQIYDRQSRIRLPLRALKRRLERAVAAVPAALRRKLPAYVEFTLVGERAIGQVHGEFFGDPAPTDVITFPHGEVLICPAVAERQRREYRRGLEDEVLLYGIHGLLHLAGRRDDTAAGAARMAREQEAVLAAVKERESCA